MIGDGDSGDCCYAIASAEVVVTGSGHEVKRLGRGEVFGEIALIEDVPRTATVTVTEDAEFAARSGTVQPHHPGNALPSDAKARAHGQLHALIRWRWGYGPGMPSISPLRKTAVQLGSRRP